MAARRSRPAEGEAAQWIPGPYGLSQFGGPGAVRIHAARYKYYGEGDAGSRSRRVGLLLLFAAAVSGVDAGSAPPVGASLADRKPHWARTAPGAWFKWSSPAIADVDGDESNDVVAGGQDAQVYVYDAGRLRLNSPIVGMS